MHHNNCSIDRNSNTIQKNFSTTTKSLPDRLNPKGIRTTAVVVLILEDIIP